MMNGYMGRMLHVDLSRSDFREEHLDETVCRQYLGGYGLGVKVLHDNMKAGTDALGPDNLLGFVTGLLTGTDALGGSRFSVVGKSPLTGTWGDSSSGGKFGPFLRFSGYDAVFFRGISSKPVYLYIDNGNVSIRDAGHLWGKDTHETEDILRDEHGKNIEVACIGPAGEKVSLIAAIMTDKGRAAGRSGLGAVMGSKKLKAVVVQGKSKVPVFDEDALTERRKHYRSRLIGLYEEFSTYGTPAVIEPFAMVGDAPVKNWSGVCDVDFPQISQINVDAVMNRVKRKYGCYKCVVACGGLMEAGSQDYVYEEGVHKPEYETVSMFGTNCLNSNIESIIKANDLCNRYGLDTISAGACISFAIECYEKNLITRQDTGGLEMTWGNHQAIIGMLEKLAAREDIGDLLANGTKIASEKIGRGSDQFAIHYHGQEVPAHNPKFEYGFASCYRLDATPARHCRWHAAFIPPGLPVPEYAPDAWQGRGQAQRVNVLYNHVIEGCGLCLFVTATYPSVDVLIEFMQAATGWDLDLEELLRTGERIANLRHLFNLREGFNPLNYTISGRLTGHPPMANGPLAGVQIDEKAIAQEFLEAMDWDLTTTVPSDAKLKELGLNKPAAPLHTGG